MSKKRKRPLGLLLILLFVGTPLGIGIFGGIAILAGIIPLPPAHPLRAISPTVYALGGPIILLEFLGVVMLFMLKRLAVPILFMSLFLSALLDLASFLNSGMAEVRTPWFALGILLAVVLYAWRLHRTQLLD